MDQNKYKILISQLDFCMELDNSWVVLKCFLGLFFILACR